MSFKEVKILINNKEIELNEFVTSIFGNVIDGMIASLNLDEEPVEIEIKVVKDK